MYARQKLWQQSAINVSLLVFAKHLRPRKVKEIYSTFYLSDILRDLIDKSDMFFKERTEFAQCCFSLPYDRDFLDKRRKNCLLGVAFRAFITLEDKYVVTYAGQEYYYRLPDEEENLILAPEWQERIAYIKNSNDLSFPSFKHPKYKNTYAFYFDEYGKPTQYLRD